MSWIPPFFPFTLLRSDPAKLETKWAPPTAHCSLYGSVENVCSYIDALALVIAWHHLGALAWLQDVVHAGHLNEWYLMVWATHWTCCPPLVPKMVLQWVAWTLTLLLLHGAIGALGAFDHGTHCTMHSHMVKLHGHPPTSHMMMALGIWQPMDKEKSWCMCITGKQAFITWLAQWTHLCLATCHWYMLLIQMLLQSMAWAVAPLPQAFDALLALHQLALVAKSIALLDCHLCVATLGMVMAHGKSSAGSWMVGSVTLALFAGVTSCHGTRAIAGQMQAIGAGNCTLDHWTWANKLLHAQPNNFPPTKHPSKPSLNQWANGKTT